MPQSNAILKEFIMNIEFLGTFFPLKTETLSPADHMRANKQFCLTYDFTLPIWRLVRLEIDSWIIFFREIVQLISNSEMKKRRNLAVQQPLFIYLKKLFALILPIYWTIFVVFCKGIMLLCMENRHLFFEVFYNNIFGFPNEYFFSAFPTLKVPKIFLINLILNGPIIVIKIPKSLKRGEFSER